MKTLVCIEEWLVRHAGLTATAGTLTALGPIFLFFWCCAVFGPVFVIYLAGIGTIDAGEVVKRWFDTMPDPMEVFGPVFVIYLGVGIILAIISAVIFFNIYFRLADLRQEREHEQRRK